MISAEKNRLVDDGWESSVINLLKIYLEKQNEIKVTNETRVTNMFRTKKMQIKREKQQLKGLRDINGRQFSVCRSLEKKPIDSKKESESGKN